MYIYNRIIRITVKAWLYYFNKLLPLGIFKKKYSHNCLVVNHFVYMEAAFYASDFCAPCLNKQRSYFELLRRIVFISRKGMTFIYELH